MNIWLVNPFDNLPMEGNRPQRYWLMARAFVRAGHDVVYWTSDFSHARKEKRDEGRGTRDEGFRVVEIPTLPYKKNICLARVRSHRRLARDFERLAEAEFGVPDGACTRQLAASAAVGNTPCSDAAGRRVHVVIASMPPLGLCEAARQMARRHGALFVSDVQDAWPETFERILPRFVWSMLGLRKMARQIYCGSDGVSAVSKRYLELAKSYGCEAPVYLAGHAIEGEGMRDEGSGMRDGGRGNRNLRLVYAGNMSLSYDLETLIETVLGLDDVTLDIAGNGPDRVRLVLKVERECQSEDERRRIRFHGYLGEAELAELLRSCDVGIVPMFPESCVGVPGKLADYAAAGLRVIESLGGECQEMVEKYGVGVHYQAGDVESLARAVEGMRDEGRGMRGFRALFDAETVMGGYVKWICELVDKK